MKKIIPILPNESFYGGAIEDGVFMPFQAGFFRDLRTYHCANQASPTLLSNKGRVIHSFSPFSYRFSGQEIEIECEDEVDVIQAGDSLKDAYTYFKNHYWDHYDSHLSILMFASPQYNTWIAMKYEPTEEKCLRYAKEILAHGYEPGVFMIDDSWALDYGVFDFNKDYFPHPKEMMDELHRLGFKVMLWETPFISPDSRSYRELMGQKCLLTDDKGEEIVTKWWNGYSCVLDLSNPKARNWLASQNQSLMDRYGVDGFKMDAADPEYYPETSHFYSGEGKAFQPKYYAEVGLHYPFNELRATFRMEGAPLAQRMKDKYSAWANEGIERLVPNALVMGLLGYFYFAPDMVGGGFLTDFQNGTEGYDQEFFIRYAEIATFMPMMQFSLAPWQCLNEKNQAVISSLLALRKKYMPKILSLKKNAEQNQEPIIRSLEYQYPHKGYEKINDEFLLGDDLLVCPVYEKNTYQRTVIIPEGKWADEFGHIYEKGTYSVSVPIERIPYFRKVSD